MKLIVNEDGEIAHATGSKTSGGTFTITSIPSLKTTAEGKKIYNGELLFSFSGGDSSETLGGTGTVVPSTVSGTGSISPSANKCFDNNNPIVLEGDEGSFTVLTGTFVPTSTGTPAPLTPLPPTDVLISSAGQNKVYGS